MPTPNYQVFQQNEKLDGDMHEAQSWSGGHSRAPIPGDEHTIDMSACERKRARRFHRFAVLSLLLVFIQFRYFFSWNPNLARDDTGTVHGPDIFDWSTHPPSKALNWTDCYGRFHCARLSVPLLYSEPFGEEGAIALIKLPSAYSPGHERYRGPVLFNPGGPGGSGVSIVLELADPFRSILSDEFDLVGFDPRGVGFTTPPLSIFYDQVEAGKFYLQFPWNLNTSESTLGDAYARASIVGNFAADRARYVSERVSTPLVARDMLSIITAFGQDKLQYWGFSYGTVLGATFSAMFPDNVGRVIIDGVVDPDDYYNGQWTNNLRDTDAVPIDIYRSCVAAGPSKCLIYENSTELVQARVNRLLDRLKTEPLSYYINSSSSEASYEVVDHAHVKTIIFRFLYQTHGTGPVLASILAALEQGDPSPFHMISPSRELDQLLQCHCPEPGKPPAPFSGSQDASFAIACGDILEDRPEDFSALRDAYQRMAGFSSFADTWTIRALCSGWKIPSKERFNGSFEQTTSHPLLLIGNTADPVTPLWNAHKVSKGFKDSVVLTQDSSGHCSIAAASLCTSKVVREYFRNGTLPDKGTVCQTESSIFGEKEFSLDALSMEERELLNASETIRRNYFVPALRGGPNPLF